MGLFLLLGLDLDRLHKLSFVEAAGSTDAVRQNERAAMRALRAGFWDQKVIGSAQT